MTKSLNKLIKLTTGSIIARQDADDVSDLTRIAKQMKFYKWVKKLLHLDHIIGSKKMTKNFLFNSKKNNDQKKNTFVHGTLLIKKQILIDIGCYDEEFYYAQDYKQFPIYYLMVIRLRQFPNIHIL